MLPVRAARRRGPPSGAVEPCAGGPGGANPWSESSSTRRAAPVGAARSSPPWVSAQRCDRWACRPAGRSACPRGSAPCRGRWASPRADRWACPRARRSCRRCPGPATLLRAVGRAAELLRLVGGVLAEALALLDRGVLLALRALGGGAAKVAVARVLALGRLAILGALTTGVLGWRLPAPLLRPRTGRTRSRDPMVRCPL